ncbi:MAG: glycosyltransferase family 4 protein [Bacteroidota bacterium]
MKILWVVNTLFPDLSIALGKKLPTAGGWMYGLARDMVERGVQLTVVTARPDLPDFQKEINAITYYLMQGKKGRERYDSTLENKWKTIVECVQPDLIHIHGTEYAHGLSLLRTFPDLKYVVSIQGLISAYTRYYFGGIARKDLRKHITFRDILKWDSMFQAFQKFQRKGIDIELSYLRTVNDFIGRTQWDLDHVKTVNPESTYHFCNESLRNPFYSSVKWDSTTKTTHSLFFSQAGYPLKGLHKALEAVAIVKRFYPNIKVRVAGSNLLKSKSIKERLSIRGYGSYVSTLVNTLGLKDHVTFTGPLNADGMVEEYLKAHAFICPSSIENSPNSLGEAQLLGVPCIAAYVGGVPDMLEHKRTGLLYRFEEVEMLAQRIMEVFKDDHLAKMLSENGIKAGQKRHDRQKNAQRLLEIYKERIETTN